MSRARVVSESGVAPESWWDPVRGDLAFRTIFGTGTTTPDITAGVAELQPGGWLGHHRHEPAEVYYVLHGEGALHIDGEEHAVRAGTAAYIPGNSEHGIRNTGSDALRFFYTFAVGSFDEVEYRFTGEE
jgi:mannose-6-phosphate isomerase-like protein (cupin superfamily)